MNPKLDHPRWTAYLLGELTAEEREACEVELAADAELRNALAEHEAVLRLLSEALAAPVNGSAEMPQHCARALPPPRAPIRFWLPTALAAMLALGFGLSRYWAPESTISDAQEMQFLEVFAEDGVLEESLHAAEALSPAASTVREEPLPQQRNLLRPSMDRAEAPPSAPAPADSEMQHVRRTAAPTVANEMAPAAADALRMEANTMMVEPAAKQEAAGAAFSFAPVEMEAEKADTIEDEEEEDEEDEDDEDEEDEDKEEEAPVVESEPAPEASPNPVE